MPETIQTLGDLSTLKPVAAPEPPKYVQKLDKQGRAYATGKRKDAVARVWVKLGAGKILINDRPVETYFARPVLRMLIQQPLVAANRQGQYDVVCTVSGRWTVGPGRCGSSRPVEGVDASRARSAQCPQAWRLPDARLALWSARNTAAPKRVAASNSPSASSHTFGPFALRAACRSKVSQTVTASDENPGRFVLFLRLISGGGRQVKQVGDFVVFFCSFPQFIFLCCAVYFQFFSAKLLQNLRSLSNR